MFSAPCQLAQYSVGFTTFDANRTFALNELDINEYSDIDINGTGLSSNQEDHREQNDHRLIYLFYTSTDVTVSTTSLGVDFNTFVSNVGGSLGLFIGFSVLGGFFFVFDIISSKVMSNDQGIFSLHK